MKLKNYLRKIKEKYYGRVTSLHIRQSSQNSYNNSIHRRSILSIRYTKRSVVAIPDCMVNGIPNTSVSKFLSSKV